MCCCVWCFCFVGVCGDRGLHCVDGRHGGICLRGGLGGIGGLGGLGGLGGIAGFDGRDRSDGSGGRV